MIMGEAMNITVKTTAAKVADRKTQFDTFRTA